MGISILVAKINNNIKNFEISTSDASRVMHLIMGDDWELVCNDAKAEFGSRKVYVPAS